jgi:hypothetical protein
MLLKKYLTANHKQFLLKFWNYTSPYRNLGYGIEVLLTTRYFSSERDSLNFPRLIPNI